MAQTRALRTIANDIESNWSNVNYGARPYLQAMKELVDINDAYHQDTGVSVVRYFLSNATQFRGEHARRIKTELKELIS